MISLPATPQEARALQESLRNEVIIQPFTGEIALVGGVDVGIHGDRGRAAIVVLDFPALQVIARSVYESAITFPYIPGLLAFRELPLILGAWEMLSPRPQLLLVDGHGLAHPRRFGIACHLGITLDLPTIGCGKSRLVGTYEEPAPDTGAESPLIDNGEVIGTVVRSRERTKPIFVSIGHRVDLPSAVAWVARCTRRYRLAEPIRMAHNTASEKERQ